MIRRKSTACLILGAAIVAAGSYAFWSPAPPTLPPSFHVKPAPRELTKALPPVDVELAPALDQGGLHADFLGNGRDAMRLNLTNKGARAVRVFIREGQTFECDSNLVVVVRPTEIVVEARETKSESVTTAAVRSSNKVAAAAYALSATGTPKLEPLLAWLRQHPEVTTPAIQTAVLAITENLPVSAFAKFARVGGDLPTQFDTSAFRVETIDMISALSALREIGIPAEQLALTIDPQLKIEAMIDPLAHAAAMHYYDIKPEGEWTFWKQELLAGNPSTRHYALYGIGRFYPDVALQMLPRWVRETKTASVFRMSAVQALAETRRPEAVSVLVQLEHELGMQTELGRAARTAADFLQADLNKSLNAKAGVGFRNAQTMPPQQHVKMPAVIAAAN